MTRTIVTWVVGAALLACSSTTRIHMEEVEVNGGAAGEAADTGGSSGDASSAAQATGTSAGHGGAGGSSSNGK